jgi:hypothetical protein
VEGSSELKKAMLRRAVTAGWMVCGWPSGGRRAATIAIFFGRLGPKANSRFRFCPEVIIRISVLTFSNRLSRKRLIPCHSLAPANIGSTHAWRLRKAFL